MSTGATWPPSDATCLNGVWHLGPVDEAIAGLYGRVRGSEQRILPDDLVRALPQVPPDHPHAAEWQVRATSMDRLLTDLGRAGHPLRVLDIGCGNGWLSARMARQGHRVTALDQHRSELEQAARTHGPTAATWCLGDPRTASLPTAHFDRIVLAASLQYFNDLPALFERLATLLAREGEVHILDTVLYPDQDAAVAAMERTRAYYARLHAPDMARHYHAHTVQALAGLGRVRTLARPAPWWSRMLHSARHAPFHHVVVRPWQRT